MRRKEWEQQWECINLANGRTGTKTGQGDAGSQPGTEFKAHLTTHKRFILSEVGLLAIMLSGRPITPSSSR